MHEALPVSAEILLLIEGILATLTSGGAVIIMPVPKELPP
jgi:hypothetical protein